MLAPNTVVSAVPAAQVSGSIFTVYWTRATPAATTEDRAQIGIHMSVRPGVQGLYDHLNATDAAFVEQSFSNYVWQTLKADYHSSWTLAEFAFRDFGADFPIDKNGVSKPGPIWRSSPQNQPGTATAQPVPYQDAATTTYRTASRKHWGRNYMPAPAVGAGIYTNQARFGPTFVDALALAFQNFISTLYGNSRQIQTVVWSPRYRGLLDVSQLVVDDIPDVVRRRRAKTASYRHIYP